jgi:glutathione S-transferase
VKDAAALAATLRDQIAELRQSTQPPDTVLARMIGHGLTDDQARRSISGLVIGAVDTTNKSFCQAIRQLLARPQQLARAEAAARDGNSVRVGQYLFEALRFEPNNPIILRHSLQPVHLASGRTIPAGRRVFIFTLAAMFDPETVNEPEDFQPGRVAPSLHFGGGMHRCQGALINSVVLPELATALLARGIQPAQRMTDGLRNEGPFPDRFPLRIGTKLPRLYTFPPSVDSETTRWILGHHRQPFSEIRRSAAGSALTILRRFAAIPILLMGGKTYSPPRAIADHLDDAAREEHRLVPGDANIAAEVDRLYLRYNVDLGRWSAQWVYFHVFQDRALALRLMTAGVSAWQATLQRTFHGIVVFFMKRGLGGLDRKVAGAALEQIRNAFSEVDQRLASGQRYLVGDRLTLADIAFCACAAPALLLEQYGGALPALAAMPKEMQQEVLHLRATAAGRWVESMYRQYYSQMPV